MDRLMLVLPTEQHKQAVWDYREEFLRNQDSMDGTGGLANAQSFEEWYQNNVNNRSGETVREGLVPATTFLGVEKESGKLVGMIDIRHRLNEYLLQFGGNIGYSVRPSQRRKGYATEMLALALEECRKLGLDRALVTCDKTNIGSAKTIQKNGGVLENEVLEGDRITQRYWIAL